MKLVLLALLLVAVVGSGMSMTNVYAGGARMDWDERYEHIPGAPVCWVDGYDDGRDNPFDHERNEECEDKGNQYYRAFIHGCASVEGNTEEICENFTDA
ncbi:MAG: hypothetical protein ACRD5J_14315 [Nitrososphaeraceae archaeon]